MRRATATQGISCIPPSPQRPHPQSFGTDNSTHAADTIFSSSAASSAPHSPLRIEHVDVALVAVTAQLGARVCPALLRASPIFSSCHDAPLHRWWSSPLKGCPPSLPGGRLGHNAIVLAHITRLPKAAVFVSGRLGLRGFHPCLDLPDNRQSAALPTCTSSRSFASSDSTTPPGISLRPAAHLPIASQRIWSKPAQLF